MKNKVKLIIEISVAVIGFATVAATVWATSANLRKQQELVTQGFADSRESNEINLRREKLEVLAAITADSQMIYREQLSKNLWWHALVEMTQHSSRDTYDNLRSDINKFYALKLKASAITSLYFPELLDTVNGYFDGIISDIDLFLRNDDNKVVRTDVFNLLENGESQAKRLDEYNNIMKLIQEEGSRLNQLATKYTGAQ